MTRPPASDTDVGSVHEHHLRAPDGWDLFARELRPARDEPCGIVIAGHAMMVDGRTLLQPRASAARPDLAHTLAEAGLRVLVPDLRGHGRSARGPLGTRMWRYDDLVADTAAWLDLAHSLAPDLPITSLGHSLFGHTTLAWMATHPSHPITRHAMLAVNLWTPSWTASPWRWAAKRASMELSSAVASTLGYLPVRRLRIGSNDEAAPYWDALVSQAREGRWCADDGTDYGALLHTVQTPVLHVVTDGDRLLAHPDDAALFSAALPQRTLWRVTHATLPGQDAPDHMTLATDPRCLPLWEKIAAWLRGRPD